jgi:hypothetical protein
MKDTKYNVDINTTPAQILAAKVIHLAILGIRKEAIATELNTSIHNVTRIIYDKRGQATLKQALAKIHADIAHTLPSLAETAVHELEKVILTSTMTKHKLDGIKMAFGLVVNLTDMTGGVSDTSVIDDSNQGRLTV